MKKVLIGIFLAASMLSLNAYGDNIKFVNLSGLSGLTHIVGDGRSSFGIHFNRGFYDYRGNRYSSRSSYLRAVAEFERQRLLSQKVVSTKSLQRSPVVISSKSFGISSSSLRTNSLRRTSSAICY